ncbi:MAG: hypothetical protein ACPG3T_01235 [Pseudomonadales bacterium]
MLKSFFRAIINGRQRSVNTQVAGFIVTEYRHSHPHLTREYVANELNSGRSVEEILG